MEDAGQLQSPVFDLGEHLELLLRVEAVGGPAPSRVARRVEALHPSVPARQQPTRLVGEGCHRVVDQLISDAGRNLDHLPSAPSEPWGSASRRAGLFPISPVEFSILSLEQVQRSCGSRGNDQRPGRPRTRMCPGWPPSPVPISAPTTPRADNARRRASARASDTAISRPPEVWASARTSCSASGRSPHSVLAETNA